jgi:hypothetical protein
MKIPLRAVVHLSLRNDPSDRSSVARRSATVLVCIGAVDCGSSGGVRFISIGARDLLQRVGWMHTLR